MIGRARAITDARLRARGLVDALTAVAAQFARSDRQRKLGLLARLAVSAIDDSRALVRLHETLCFLQAYPDDRAVLEAVDQALADFPARVKRLGSRAIRRLSDSGIAGTTLEYPFGFPMARWLASRFPRDVNIAWDKLADDEQLEEWLIVLLHPTEHDAYSDEGGLGWRRWLELAKGGRAVSDLQVLLELFSCARLDDSTRDRLFESLALAIEWRLDGRSGSRTLAKLPWPRPFFHGGIAFGRPSGHELIREIKRTLPSLRPVSPALATGLIEAARLAMATRLRELFAFSYANPRDVLVADLDRGLRIALIGLLPKARLPYEGYYAYLALKNGVPVGYGAAWQLFGTLELAVNMFDSFRRGESAYIVSQVLRAYHQALGMRRVVVDAYQIGHDNPEALRSGAFYFYSRLGFRSQEVTIERLAQQERIKRARDIGYRSPRSVLEKFAGFGMHLSLSRPVAPSEPPITASRLASLVTADISRRFQGNRRSAARQAVARVARVLGVPRWTRWPRDERYGFAQLSLLITLIPDLDRWARADRRRLAEVLRAKGGPSEARYVRLLDGHQRLRQSLAALVAARQSPPLSREARTAPTPSR